MEVSGNLTPCLLCLRRKRCWYPLKIVGWVVPRNQTKIPVLSSLWASSYTDHIIKGETGGGVEGVGGMCCDLGRVLTL